MPMGTFLACQMPAKATLTPYQAESRTLFAQLWASAVRSWWLRRSIPVNGAGHYSATLPQGTHDYTINANGYIEKRGQITVSASGSFHFCMSPELRADQWRIEVSWGQNPRDLDSHLQFGAGCPEMFYGRRSASCEGVTAALDVDDTSSWGPETTTLSNTQSCSGNCQWIYKVKNYSGRYDRTHGWQHSQATVTVYNGNRQVGNPFEVNANHGYTPSNGIGSFEFWSVLKIDGATGRVHECRNAACN